MNERRSLDRKPVRFLVQHQTSTDAGYEVDYASDLSAGGMFIRSNVTPTPHATVHVQFAPAKDAPLVSTFARVTHVTPHGFGTAFIGLDAEGARAISSVL
ncbi:MAG: PilZ domain-containing protein [Archangiaceae bacterium]|nr:PilZ domain-containing protein [Archangiaceae bacterium]